MRRPQLLAFLPQALAPLPSSPPPRHVPWSPLRSLPRLAESSPLWLPSPPRRRRGWIALAPLLPALAPLLPALAPLPSSPPLRPVPWPPLRWLPWLAVSSPSWLPSPPRRRRGWIALAPLLCVLVLRPNVHALVLSPSLPPQLAAAASEQIHRWRRRHSCRHRFRSTRAQPQCYHCCPLAHARFHST